MKNIVSTICLIATLFFAAQAMAQEFEVPRGDFEEMRKTGVATASEVVNPLTIKLEDGRFIHLTGMDIPDLDYYDPGELSVTAVKILDDFLKGQKIVLYQTSSSKEGRQNALGHHIAHIARAKDDGWVQGLLLSLGLARTRTTLYNDDMADQMLNLEDNARRAKNGLWAMEDYQVLPPEKAQEHIGSYQIVEGAVKSASMHRNRLYLNFGNNWRDDFTVSISAFDLKRFTRAKIYPQQWNGKKLRVRGWIETYNGPYMEIDHPARFEAIFEKSQPATPEPEKDQTIETDPGSALPKLND